MNTKYDVAIIGGGPAGLSAALTLGRGNRSVIVFDDNRPRNAPSAHMNNFPSRDGTPPNEFRELIKKDLMKYKKIHFSQNRINEIKRTDAGFVLDGNFEVKRILLAHGIKDNFPPIPGMKELFGKSIFHCPYCHGYELLNAPMGMVGDKEYADHMSVLLRNLSSDLILFSDGAEVGEYPGIKVYKEKIVALIHEGEQLTGVKLESGEIVKRSFLFTRPKLTLSSDIGVKLGCELTETGLYKVSEMGLTSVTGVYAAGDISTPMQSVLMACASGSKAAAMMNLEISKELYS